MKTSRVTLSTINRTSAPLVTGKDAAQVGLEICLPLRLGIRALVAITIWLTPPLALPPRAELMARWDISMPVGRLADLCLTP